jgi:hypothetical protein
MGLEVECTEAEGRRENREQRDVFKLLGEEQTKTDYGYLY